MTARLDRVALAAGWGVGRLVVEGGGVFALCRELRQLARWHDGPPLVLLLDAEELAPPATAEQVADLAAVVVELWRSRIDLVADPESPVAGELLGGIHTKVTPSATSSHTAGTAPAPVAGRHGPAAVFPSAASSHRGDVATGSRSASPLRGPVSSARGMRLGTSPAAHREPSLTP